jgi:hypothetical protein
MIDKLWILIEKLASVPDDLMDIHDDEENDIMGSWMDF